MGKHGQFMNIQSTNAAEILKAAREAKDARAEKLALKTDCAAGCLVPLNGTCPHGYESAARTLYMEEFRQRNSVP